MNETALGVAEHNLRRIATAGLITIAPACVFSAIDVSVRANVVRALDAEVLVVVGVNLI